MWKWMPFLCFLKGIKKRLGKRLEETSSPKGPSELQQERWKISSVNYWSETRLPSSVCQEIACPLAPPWKCDEAAEAVSGFPGRYTMLHVPMFFLLMPSPAETEWGRGGALSGEREENWQGTGWIWDPMLSQAPLTNVCISSGLRSSH